MPQSSKDANGGKTHGAKDSKSKSKGVGEQAKTRGSSDKSPVGAQRHGEKKSTPH